jgi:hypothetical protein
LFIKYVIPEGTTPLPGPTSTPTSTPAPTPAPTPKHPTGENRTPVIIGGSFAGLLFIVIVVVLIRR